MPAITLGLAEVEDRLRALRRRLNAVTLIHALALALSPTIFCLAALILFGLRGSTDAFRVVTWCGVALSLGALLNGALMARRRWLSLENTARLVDQRGELTDRLTTIMDLRLRPRPARLAPVLVAQTLAMGAQWRAERIAPRRIPRSVYLLLAALLTLAGSPLIAPEPPPPPAAGSTSAAAAAVDSLVPASPREALRGAAVGVAGIEAGSTTGQQPNPDTATAGQMPAPESLPSSAEAEKQKADSLLGLLPDRLRHAILGAFHADQVHQPQELTARADLGSRDPTGHGDRTQDDQDRQGQNADANKQSPKTHAAPQDTHAEHPGQEKGPGKPKSEQLVQREDGKSPSQNFEGSSPAAGDGTSPGALMDGKGQAVTAADGAPKTFKLTITSFLRAMEQKGDQPRQPSKKTATGGSVGIGNATQVALNERQLNDDALRKAEIPPEYEDIVRRVYSLRADQ